MSDPLDQIKVDYTTAGGWVSTAYVTPDIWRGINKHTDEPVAIRWDGTAWVEVTK